MAQLSIAANGLSLVRCPCARVNGSAVCFAQSGEQIKAFNYSRRVAQIREKIGETQ